MLPLQQHKVTKYTAIDFFQWPGKNSYDISRQLKAASFHVLRCNNGGYTGEASTSSLDTSRHLYNLDLHIFHVVEDNCKSNRHILNPTKKLRIVIINNQQNANTYSLQSKINCQHLRSTEHSRDKTWEDGKVNLYLHDTELNMRGRPMSSKK